MVDQCSAVLRTVVGMHRKTGSLIHQQDLIILVYDIQLRHRHGKIGIILPGFIKKLVVDIKLQHISLVQPGVPVDALAVALDPLQADIFLRQGRRQQGNRLSKKTV